MALNTHITEVVANAAADAVTALLADGYLRVYSGAQPATPETAITDQLLITEHRFSATAAPPAVEGVATYNALTIGTSSISATATWFRALQSDGSTPVYDGSVGTSGANLILQTNEIQPAGAIVIQGLTYSARLNTPGY